MRRATLIVALVAAAAAMAPAAARAAEPVVAPAARAGGPWRDPSYQPRPGHWRDYVLAPAGRLLAPAAVQAVHPRAGGIEGDPAALLRADGRGVTLTSTGDRSGSPLVTLDFGQEVAGKVALRVLAASDPAPELHVCFSESLRYAGHGSTDRMGIAPGCDTANIYSGLPGFPYSWDADSHTLRIPSTLPGEARDEQLRGGFRYATIFLDGPGSVTLDSLELHYTAAPKQADLRDYRGWFLSSDNALNRIWYAGAYTVQVDTSAPDTAKSWPYANGERDHADDEVPHADPNREVIFDGGKRDRIVWQGDLAVQAPVTYLSTDDLGAVDNSLSSLAAQQLDDGYMPAESLVGPHNYGEIRTYGEYVTWFVNNMYDHWLYTGDEAYLRRWWPALERAVAWLESVRAKDPGGLINFANGGNACGHYGYFRCGYDTYSNALYARNLHQMSKLAAALGDDAGARSYRRRFGAVREDINAQLWDEDAGAYRAGRDSGPVYPQDANATAVLAGVATGRRARRAIHYLEEHNGGPYGSLTVPAAAAGIPSAYQPLPSGFEVEARQAVGDDRAAEELMRTFWGYQLAADGPQSTFWEHLGTDGHPLAQEFSSLAHGWASGPTIALTTGVLGVRPTGPGFSTWSIDPYPGSVRWAQGAVPTPRGKLTASWRRDAWRSRFTLELDAPAGTSGEVQVPTFGRDSTVRVDGRLAWNGRKAKAYHATEDARGVTLHGIGAGSHEIEVRPAGAPVVTLDAAVSPQQASVRPGTTQRLEVTLDGEGKHDLSGTLTATVPDGWTASPSRQGFTIHTGGSEGETRLAVDVAVPPDAADGDYPVRLAARTPGGPDASATATLHVSHALAEWTFDRDGDAEGWQPTNDLTPFTVSGGILRTSSTGGDPYMVQGAPLSLDDSSGLVVELRMRTSVSSGGQLFWTTAASGYFSEDKSTTFPVTGGDWQTYRVAIPAGASPITGLRLDPLRTAGDIAIDAIRVLPAR